MAVPTKDSRFMEVQRMVPCRNEVDATSARPHGRGSGHVLHRQDGHLAGGRVGRRGIAARVRLDVQDRFQ